MKLINIKESGSNNVLMWAINNDADIKNDPALQSIINDDLSYNITISDINFFELFRLTQMYRDKLRIVYEEQAEMPAQEELQKLFNGVYAPDADKPSDTIPFSEIVEHCGNMFLNLAMQMSADDDIISTSAVRMFLPMISRKFTIQIPVYFSDLVSSMSVDEANEIYNKNYPSTLNTIIESESHGVKMKLEIAILKSTSIIKYDKQYETYIKAIKYAPLKTCNNDKLYKLSILAFSKYDNVSRSDIRFDLFNPNKNNMESILKTMGNNDNPLELDFVIQLPIQYMQILENSFSHEVLTIAYESSMSNIIDGGLKYDNFLTSEYIEDTETDEEKIKVYNNSVESYKTRITEANQLTLNTMPILLNSDGDVHIPSVFAMLPSIYTTKAVIRINMKNADVLRNHYDPIIKEMFEDAFEIANAVISDINKTN